MKSVCLLLAACAVAVGCQQGESSSGSKQGATPVAPPTGDYASDIAALCDAVARSGAGDDDAKALTIANWLAANLKTPESRKFLVEIQPLTGEPKAARLEAEARRVGLSGCALAAEWRTPTP